MLSTPPSPSHCHTGVRPSRHDLGRSPVASRAGRDAGLVVPGVIGMVFASEPAPLRRNASPLSRSGGGGGGGDGGHPLATVRRKQTGTWPGGSRADAVRCQSPSAHTFQPYPTTVGEDAHFASAGGQARRHHTPHTALRECGSLPSPPPPMQAMPRRGGKEKRDHVEATSAPFSTSPSELNGKGGTCQRRNPPKPRRYKKAAGGGRGLRGIAGLP